MKIDYQKDTITVVKTKNEVSEEYSKIIFSYPKISETLDGDKVILIFKK